MKSHQQHLTGEGETVCGFIKAAEVSPFTTFLSYQADSWDPLFIFVKTG